MLIKPTINIMLDSETLGTKPGCKILSIGMVSFKDRNDIDFELYLKLTLKGQDKLIIEEKTLIWWESQDPAIYEEALSGIVCIEYALLDIQEKLSNLAEDNRVVLWSKSASFDIQILKYAFEVYGIEVPWHFRDEMCFRTLVKLFPDVYPPKFEGDKHSALHDARHQARHAERIFKHMRYYVR